MHALTRQLAMLVLLPQLLVAVLAPAFLVCDEGSGGRSLELSASGCCVTTLAVSHGDTAELHEQKDCGDCEDTVLTIQQRDEKRTMVSPSIPVRTSDWAEPVLLQACEPSPAPTPAALDPTLVALRTVNLRC